MLIDIFSSPKSGVNVLIMIMAFVTIVVLPLLSRLNFFSVGAQGERIVARKLKRLGDEYEIFNNVIVGREGHTSQIDHIVISKYGIFVVETKNYKGWIFGKADSYYWTQNIYGHKYNLYNPLFQNKKHVKALQAISPSTPCEAFRPVVVFTKRALLQISGVDNQPLLYSNHVCGYVRSFSDTILSEEQKAHFVIELKQHALDSKESRVNHIVEASQTSSRHEAMLDAGVCPQCGGQLVERQGRYGRFWGCSNYPKCKFTLNK